MPTLSASNRTHYLTLRNKADMEIEATGWVSEETDDALEANLAKARGRSVSSLLRSLRAG